VVHASAISKQQFLGACQNKPMYDTYLAQVETGVPETARCARSVNTAPQLRSIHETTNIINTNCPLTALDAGSGVDGKDCLMTAIAISTASIAGKKKYNEFMRAHRKKIVPESLQHNVKLQSVGDVGDAQADPRSWLNKHRKETIRRRNKNKDTKEKACDIRLP